MCHHRASKAALESGLLNGELLRAEDVLQAWGTIVSEIRSGMLGLPTRLAQVAISATSLREIETACRVEIYAVLEKLASGADNDNADQGADNSGDRE